jgi:hypothetical protein
MKKLLYAFMYLYSYMVTFFKSSLHLFNEQVRVHLRQWSVVALSILALAVTPQLAHAALPAGIATGLDAVEADAAALFDLVWPVVLTIFGGMVLFKLFKRAGAKI